MEISMQLGGTKDFISNFILCSSPENNETVKYKKISDELLTIKIKNAKLSSIYSIIDEYLKIVDLLKEIDNIDYS
jgi:hypothetical protein